VPNAFRSSPASIFNGRLGYAFDNGWKVQFDAPNLFNTKANQIMYAYGSLLRSDPLYAQCKSATPPPVTVCQIGVMDAVLHPTEPPAARPEPIDCPRHHHMRAVLKLPQAPTYS
jgi:hypothetical protein